MQKSFFRTLLLFSSLLLLVLSSCDSKFSGEDILTREERTWLKNHKDIKIAISTSFPPFQFREGQKDSKGLSVDFLDLIEKKINYKFERVYFDNWQDILNSGKTGETDVILEIQENIDRKKYFNFTNPFIEVPHAIIMRKDFKKAIQLSEMEGLKIAVVENYAIHDFLREKYPGLTLIPMTDDMECIRAVSLQNADAMVSSQGIAVYLIQKGAISNLHIVGHAEYRNILAFAVRKDWPILTRIIDKGLSRISHSERNDIYSHWLQLEPISFWRQKNFWLLIGFLLGLSVLIIALISLWNKTLQRQVALKTKQLQIAKEHAEESNRLKSSFLANMSHEIRTPLNAIQGFSQLITQQELDSEKKNKYSQIIDTNCRSLTHLINEILDLSKIEAGQISILKEKVPLHPLLEEIKSTHEDMIRHKMEVEFIVEAPDLPDDFHLTTDPLRLKQVLNNLLSNAEKFTTQGCITLGYSLLNETEILFYVKDTGIGIAPESLNYIFDRFTKIEGDMNTLYRGSGLGLHISKKLVELIGGNIWVESEPGKGSSFFFTIPIK